MRFIRYYLVKLTRYPFTFNSAVYHCQIAATISLHISCTVISGTQSSLALLRVLKRAMGLSCEKQHFGKYLVVNYTNEFVNQRAKNYINGIKGFWRSDLVPLMLGY